jgi:hypothetical protein
MISVGSPVANCYGEYHLWCCCQVKKHRRSATANSHDVEKMRHLQRLGSAAFVGSPHLSEHDSDDNATTIRTSILSPIK